MPQAQIRKITISSYSVDTMSGTLDQGETLVLTQEGGAWKSPAGAVKEDVAKSMAATLDGLKIVDARPKPIDLAHDLGAGQMRLSMGTVTALQRYGFLLTQSGRMLGSDGEMSVEMANGVAYQIRFGDVAASGTEAAKSGGGDRYLFVTATWDQARATKYGDTAGTGEKAARDLNARFADWFYVISNADFQRIRLKKVQVVR
jgi:hypothetical protein